MRFPVFAITLLLAACETAPPPPDPELPAAPLPDYRPETAAACAAVKMSVALAVDGSLKLNGLPTDTAGLETAAAAKDAACRNTPAMVGLDVAMGVPIKQSDMIRDVLGHAITNLALVESANQGNGQ